MKKLVLATSLLALFSGTALAADMAVKGPAVPIAVVPSWAGFYFSATGIKGSSDPAGGDIFWHFVYVGLEHQHKISRHHTRASRLRY